MKCGRIGCTAEGLYQPLIRIKASVLPANGNEVLALIRLPFAVCMKCRLATSTADVLAAVPVNKMKKILEDAKQKTGALPNPDRTDVHWVRILGRRTDG